MNTEDLRWNCQFTCYGCYHPYFLFYCCMTDNRTSEWGDIGLFIALVPKVFLIVGLITLGTYWIVINWFYKSSVQTFQQLNITYRRINFVYHHCIGDVHCTSINRHLSFPYDPFIRTFWENIIILYLHNCFNSINDFHFFIEISI